MTGPSLNLEYLLLCFVTSAAAVKVLPPENVELVWSGLFPQLSWTPPSDSDNCSFSICSTNRDGSAGRQIVRSSPFREIRPLNGGFLNVSIRTVCGDRESAPVFAVFDDPDLPLSCLIKSSDIIHCSWKSDPSADIRLFYSFPVSDTEMSPLRECLEYSGRSSCDLRLERKDEQLNVLLNGTHNRHTTGTHNRHTTVTNNYEIPNLKLSLSPLSWNVSASSDHFVITWTPPAGFSHFTWKYFLRYSSCSETTEEEVSGFSWSLQRSPFCSYTISLRGIQDQEETGQTDWTNEQTFEGVSSFNPLVLAMVLLPLLLMVLVLLSLAWCIRNKKRVFPKVPQPNPELFKDIINNNNKVHTPDLYLPKGEEECHVTLVLDPSLIQPQL